MTTPTPGIAACLSHPRTTAKILSLLEPQQLAGRRLLDVGAGEGYFLSQLHQRMTEAGIDPAGVLRACDLYPEHFKFRPVPCDKAALDQRLPYDDQSFDLALCMEVIEHVADQRHLITQLSRVLKPGGRLLLTTPNILNLNGRLRFLCTGTWPLFDMLPIAQSDVVTVTGHIHPVSLYYLFYFLRGAGFDRIEFHVDRAKRSSIVAAGLFWPLMKLSQCIADRRRRREPYYAENRAAVAALNRLDVLVGRTLIIDARKSAT